MFRKTKLIYLNNEFVLYYLKHFMFQTGSDLGTPLTQQGLAHYILIDRLFCMEITCKSIVSMEGKSKPKLIIPRYQHYSKVKPFESLTLSQRINAAHLMSSLVIFNQRFIRCFPFLGNIPAAC